MGEFVRNYYFHYLSFKKLFDTISQYYPEFANKLVAIQGDLLEPNLGISDEDEKVLINNVNIVFHSAATVRFDEPLKL
jgi:thioester reductase-like protein